MPSHAKIRPWPALLAAIAVAALASSVLAAGPQAAPDEPGGHASTHVIARLKPGSRARLMADGARWTLQAPGPDRPRRSARIAAALERWGTTAVRPAMAHRAADRPLASVLRLDDYVRIEVAPGTDTQTMARNLARWTDVIDSVSVDGIGSTAVVPDDTFFNTQYALLNTGQVVNGQAGTSGADVSATVAWELTTGSPDIVLAVLDAGMDPHTQLGARMLDGWNVINENNDTSDACVSHGTHVAGIAAALGNDGAGTAGMDWNCKILPVRILNGCAGFESDLAEGIVWAVDNGADVINMSLQYSTGSDLLRDAVRYAYEREVIMIAASGNNGFTGTVAFPARLPETIAVGGVDNRDFPPSFAVNGWTSNPGPEVDVAAPGDDIYSLYDSNQYAFKNGTSMATPFVSGLVTLMLAVNPDLTIEATRKILRETASDIWTPGFDENTGWGRVNAAGAIVRVLDGQSTPGDVTGDALVNVLDLVAVLQAWGSCPAESACPADLDGSDVVDVVDLTIVIENWGGGPD